MLDIRPWHHIYIRYNSRVIEIVKAKFKNF